MTKYLVAPLALAAAVVLGAAPRADAAFQVTFGAGASTKTIVDGGIGDLDGDANDILVISEIVGGYDFQVTLATTNTPGAGGISFVNTDTARVEYDSGANTTAFIRVSANNFTVPAGDVTAFSSATGQYKAPTPAGSTATVSFTAWVDASNTIDGMATEVGSASGSISQPGDPNIALQDSQSATGLGTPYTLTFEVMIAYSSTGQVADLDGQLFLTAVPEPGTLAMAAAGLPLLGGLYLARRRARTGA